MSIWDGNPLRMNPIIPFMTSHVILKNIQKPKFRIHPLLGLAQET